MEIQAIKKYMKENKITYEELAEKSKLSISTIKKIFSGISQYPRVDTIKAIENALGLSTEWTSEELKAGVGDHPVTLSKEEWEIIELFSELEMIKGTAYKNAILDLIRSVIYAENKKN